MVSSSQIKAAHAMLLWSAIEFANRSGVGKYSFKHYEVQLGIHIADTKKLMVIINTFEEDGIESTGDPLVNTSITLRIKRDNYVQTGSKIMIRP